MKLRNLLLATLGVAAIAGAATSASAYSHYYWHNHHRVYVGAARRVQVNNGISNANRKIQWEHRTGKINAYQAHALYAHNKHVRIRTDVVAGHQGGNLTPAQQADLNHQTAAHPH